MLHTDASVTASSQGHHRQGAKVKSKCESLIREEAGKLHLADYRG